MKKNFSFNKPKIRDEEIINYINQRENVITISWVSPYTGILHSCPVWGIFFDGRFYFQTEDYLAKTKAIKKGYNQIGITIINPQQFPDYSEGEIPYISLGGKATIHTSEFKNFKKIIEEIFIKYFDDEKKRKEVLTFVLEKVKSRVLIEVFPKWIKAGKVPKTKN